MTFLVWIIYILIFIAIVYVIWRQIKKMDVRSKPTTAAKPIFTQRSVSGVQSDILAEGTGAGAKNRDSLTVHYTAYLTNGKEVDSSRDRGRTLTFVLGAGKVIEGWDEALVGAKVGERRRVTVPPELAYGRKGTQKIPPNATVIFEVELLKIN